MCLPMSSSLRHQVSSGPGAPWHTVEGGTDPPAQKWLHRPEVVGHRPLILTRKGQQECTESSQLWGEWGVSWANDQHPGVESLSATSPEQPQGSAIIPALLFPWGILAAMD